MESIKCKICQKEFPESRLVSHIKFKHKDYTTLSYIETFGEFRPSVLKNLQKKAQKLESEDSIECELCGSVENMNSFRGHLRWKHEGWNSDKYAETFGEFRPQKIKNIQDLKESEFECKICGVKVKSHQHLMYHLTKSHTEITQTEYIIKYLSGGKVNLCKCGCGQPTKVLRSGKNDKGKETYYRDYVKGHVDWDVFSNINKQSKEEIQLVDFIKSFYKGVIEESKRGIIKGKEIDIYLPDINLGLEYNGLYWHSEKVGRGKEYHLNKMNQANTKGIRLIQIFSDEWINRQDIVKSRLKQIIGVSQEKSIYARKCKIIEIKSDIKNNFLDTYHIQGSDKAFKSLGLFHNEELVAVMTFSKPRMVLGQSNREGVYELSRYATSTQVVGGASKLLKNFIINYNPKEVYSYSDNRWSDPNNNMYLKIGFNKESQSKPGYFYTKDFKTRLHRFNFSKQNLKKKGLYVEGKTEFEIMDSLGYARIWDCGTTKFKLTP